MYPHLLLKGASIRWFSEMKKTDLSKLRRTSSTITVPTVVVITEIQELPLMKTGMPLLFPEELDTQVQEYIKEQHKHGPTVSTVRVVATAQGIMNKDANLPYSNGRE